MYKIISLFFISLITVQIVSQPVLAASVTPSKISPTPSSKVKPSSTQTSEEPTDTAEQDRIEKIKEMVAEKVAKLKLVEKRGVIGTVKEVSNTQLTIEDDNNTLLIIDTDELTKFQDNSGSSSKTFGISDIKSGDYLSFVGLYNKETKRLLARAIVKVKSIPLFFEGAVVEKDTKNFTLTAVDDRGIKRTINFENSTKTQSYTKEDGMVKSGYSKIEEAQRIFVAGFEDKDDKNIINASRVIFFIELPPSPNMQKFVSIDTSDSPVSTGSGKKLQPLTR